jgi:hypothetical protein
MSFVVAPNNRVAIAPIASFQLSYVIKPDKLFDIDVDLIARLLSLLFAHRHCLL